MVRLECCAFFLFKQKTAYEVRISDWSSDVCSSDLVRPHLRRLRPVLPGRAGRRLGQAEPALAPGGGGVRGDEPAAHLRGAAAAGLPASAGTPRTGTGGRRGGEALRRHPRRSGGRPSGGERKIGRGSWREQRWQ